MISLARLDAAQAFHWMTARSTRVAQNLSRGGLFPPLGEEDLALALMVGLADHAVFFHALDQPRGAVIADLQPALDVGGRDLALARDDGDRLVVEIIAPFAAGKTVGVFVVFVGLFCDGIEIFGVALRFPE